MEKKEHTADSNKEFDLAMEMVNTTRRAIFLTGKAGTGKTYFLRALKTRTPKQAVVVAPTGVAAINAGGVTIHSFFQLPFGPFLPDAIHGTDENATSKQQLLRHVRFNAEKRKLLEGLELLIIDEISMVRADTLDAMDAVLRHFRKKPFEVFGGVQVVYIGDMFQLPPVVDGNEWSMLQQSYQSPFFFSAHAIAAQSPVYIELKKIYRQHDEEFINLLNKVRHNEMKIADFALLNRQYRPGFVPDGGQPYITLSTHNNRATAINTEALGKLTGKMFVFMGTVTGEFPEKSYPTAISLALRVGAQVMFIKNDSGGDRKYFNGKLATVKKIAEDSITVTANADGSEQAVEKEKWLNIRYSLDKHTGRLKEEELGSFTQYPLKLAWAVTIHKSQGLTFDRAIIDAGGSFAAGQVYVALSRCTALAGVILLSKIEQSDISTDNRVIAFSRKAVNADQLEQFLREEKEAALKNDLLNIFRFDRLLSIAREIASHAGAYALLIGEQGNDLISGMPDRVTAEQLIAAKFREELSRYFGSTHSTNREQIGLRIQQATSYFANSFYEKTVQPADAFIASLQPKPLTKKIRLMFTDSSSALKEELKKLLHARWEGLACCEAPESFSSWFNPPTTAKKTSRRKQQKQKS